jgi:diguanylate cyclase (GGDEF)-like protein
MTDKLCLLCCENYRAAFEATIAAEGWTDIALSVFPARCGRPPMNWDELRPLLAADCTQVEVVGNACLAELEALPTNAPPVSLVRQEDCLHKQAERTGGVISLEYVRQWLGRRVAEWRLAEAKRQADQHERDSVREVADHKAAMDFLGRLPLLKDERETITEIEEMFHLLFAPQVFCYLNVEGGSTHNDCELPPDLFRQAQALRNDWAWTESGTGFLLRIARAGETLGVIVVDRMAFPQYRDRYVNLALSISGVAGLAIDNARTYRRLIELQHELEQEAHTDALTGCVTRRHFLELAQLELARARRHDEEVSLLMLDMDHFKEINDLHGHPVGDLVLQELVRACQTALRREDTIGRLGGEEFAILLPETGRDKALEVATRLCGGLATAEVPLNGKPSIRFTASIGVTTMTHEDMSVGTILGRADHALYEAKRAGRNRVVAG